MIGAVENGPLRAEAIFARKKIILQYFEKHLESSFDYF